MAKKQKTFILSDESVNSYGFSIDMDKLDIERFKTNPVMLYNHDQLVGKWDNIQLKNGKLTGTPVFMDSENEPEALKIKERVEGNYVNGASIGMRILGVEEKDGEAPKVSAEILECSVCDIPANPNAVQLYGEVGEKLEGKSLQLALEQFNKQDENKENDTIMKKILLSATALVMLGVKENTELSADEIEQKIKGIADERDQLQDKLSAIEEKQVTDLIDKAVSDGRILEGKREHFTKLAKQDFDTAKEVIGSMPAKKDLTTEVDDSNENSEDRSSWTFSEWNKKDTAGLLKIKAEDPNRYAQIQKKK